MKTSFNLLAAAITVVLSTQTAQASVPNGAVLGTWKITYPELNFLASPGIVKTYNRSLTVEVLTRCESTYEFENNGKSFQYTNEWYVGHVPGFETSYVRIDVDGDSGNYRMRITYQSLSGFEDYYLSHSIIETQKGLAALVNGEIISHYSHSTFLNGTADFNKTADGSFIETEEESRLCGYDKREKG
jgi:hypothetical protein